MADDPEDDDLADDGNNGEVDVKPHPRFSERRAAVEDQTNRSRQRKLIAFAAVVLALLLAAAATQSALLDVDEVRIVGATHNSPDSFRTVAGIEPGTPILGLDTDAAEARLLELPEVIAVTASKTWGGVVTIEIDERVPVARIDSDTGTIVVAADGVVLDVVPRPFLDESETERAPVPEDLVGLPEIAGVIFVTERGSTVPDVLTEALMVADALPVDIAAVTERVEITVDSLVLKAVGGGRISLGDARDLNEKFEAVRAFLAQVDLSCLDTLNVRAPSVPVIRRTENC